MNQSASLLRTNCQACHTPFPADDAWHAIGITSAAPACSAHCAREILRDARSAQRVGWCTGCAYTRAFVPHAVPGLHVVVLACTSGCGPHALVLPEMQLWRIQDVKSQGRQVPFMLLPPLDSLVGSEWVSLAPLLGLRVQAELAFIQTTAWLAHQRERNERRLLAYGQQA